MGDLRARLAGTAVLVALAAWVACDPSVACGAIAASAPTAGAMERTREVLEASNRIVTGPGDRNQKLAALKDLLRDFLDTDALARKAMGKHLDGRTPEQVSGFLAVFRELFVRTYVQRLLLFDVPEFGYGEEKVSGDSASVATEIVTPKDRFAVDYHLQRRPGGWVATDILVEEVSLADNFRAQFDRALAKDSFDALVERLRNKLAAKPSAADFQPR